MGTPQTKDIFNTIYHSAVITGLAIASSMVGKRLVKLDVGDPSKADLKDFIKLTVVMTAAAVSKHWLVLHKIIPEDILKTS